MDIYLGSEQLNNTKRFCTGIQNLLFSSVTFSSSDNGGMFGRTLSPSKLRSYSFNLSFVLLGTTFADLDDEREAFMGLLAEIISMGEKRLRIVKPNGKDVFLDVKSIKADGDFAPENGNSFPLLITFEAEYPLLQSIDEQINQITIFSGGGFAIPFAIPFAMNVGGASDSIIVNNGNYEAYPIITFYGDMTNPTFTNNTTGESMSLTATLANSSEYIVVDTFLRTVVNQAGNSVRGNFSGDFLKLAKGANFLKLTTASGSAGKAIIRHRDHYVGA